MIAARELEIILAANRLYEETFIFCPSTMFQRDFFTNKSRHWDGSFG